MFYVVLAALFGAGWTPVCPGTAACAAGVIVFLLIKSPIHFLILTVVSIFVSFLVSGRAERVFGEKDCKKIVIDDFSGMLIALLFIPKEPAFIFCAFFLFRALDMVKIPPADKVEAYRGARGIVGDDIIAGVYANFILQIVKFLV